MNPNLLEELDITSNKKVNVIENKKSEPMYQEKKYKKKGGLY